MKSKNVKPGMRVRIITEATVVEWGEDGNVLDDVTEKIKLLQDVPSYTVSIEDYEKLEDVCADLQARVAGLGKIEDTLEARILELEQQLSESHQEVRYAGGTKKCCECCADVFSVFCKDKHLSACGIHG